METKIDIIKESGKKKVRLHDDGYGLELLTMRNGYQWTGAGVDTEILIMLREVIDEYFAMTVKKEPETEKIIY